MPVTAATQRESGELLKRVAVWSAAALVLILALYAIAWALGRGAENHGADLRADIGRLEPQLRALEQQRADRTRDEAVRAMLATVQMQGPRLARVLEALARATPDDVVFDSMNVTANGAVWRVPIKGHVDEPVAATAETAFSRFLAAAQAFPLLGVPVVAPTSKLATVQATPDQLPDSAASGTAAATAGGNAQQAAGPNAPSTALVNPEFYRQYPVTDSTDVAYLRTRVGERPPPVRIDNTWYWPGPQGGAGATRASGAQPKPAGVARPSSTLDFTVEFEVKK